MNARLVTACTKTALTLMFITAFWLAAAPTAQAQKLQIVLTDGLWGAGIGALIGTAVVVLADEPEDELDRIPRYAAIGAVLGVAFGFLEISGAFASYDSANHRLVLGPPTPRFDLTPEGRQRTRIELFETRF